MDSSTYHFGIGIRNVGSALVSCGTDLSLGTVECRSEVVAFLKKQRDRLDALLAEADALLPESHK